MGDGATQVLVATGAWGLSSVLGAVGVLWQRRRLVSWVSERFRRFALQAGPLLVLELAAALLGGTIGLDRMWSATSLTTAQSAVLWLLCVVLTLRVVLQAFVVVHADDAEIRQIAVAGELDDARSERDFFTLLNTSFVQVVSQKRETLRRGTDRKAVFSELPNQSRERLLGACWSIVNGLIQAGNSTGHQHRVRVALFRAGEEGLDVAASFDGTQSNCVCLRAEVKREYFRWDGKRNSLAKSVATTGVARLVQSATEAHNNPDHPFKFFLDEERQALKSICALPLKLEQNDGNHCDVLVLDTDREGFFDPASRALGIRIDYLRKNMVHRLHVEDAMEAIAKED
jgi:hypothetical protein